jgi:DNA invertase Pin-like site-specific DNA recombinase
MNAALNPHKHHITLSTDYGLDQEFNSLDAQYDAGSAYIKSQAHAGWTLIRSRYDDGGYSGASTDRPNLQRLLDDIRIRKIDVIVVYKVDRLTRSLADFAKLVELGRSNRPGRRDCCAYGPADRSAQIR